MQIRRVLAHSSCSFFLINKKCEVLLFNLDPSNDLKGIIVNYPIVGGNIEEIIPQRYKFQLLRLIDKCFRGNCFSIDVKPGIRDFSGLPFQIVFTPLLRNNEKLVVCTVVNIDHQVRMLNDYSLSTFHELRTSATNILSLLSAMSYEHTEPYDILKINKLLIDISKQAEKLNDVIKILYSLLKQKETTQLLKVKYLETKKQHIVLVDDDIITGKIHQTLIRDQYEEKHIVLFNDPKTALDYIKNNLPDLILLDLHMPQIDGFKFLEMINSNQISVDVIIVSSSLDPNERSRVRAFDFVKDFIVKPLTNEKVKMIFEN